MAVGRSIEEKEVKEERGWQELARGLDKRLLCL